MIPFKVRFQTKRIDYFRTYHSRPFSVAVLGVIELTWLGLPSPLNRLPPKTANKLRYHLGTIFKKSPYLTGISRPTRPW